MKNFLKTALVAFAFTAFVSSCDQAATTDTTTETVETTTTPEPAVLEPTESVTADTVAAPEADASATNATEPAPAQ